MRKNQISIKIQRFGDQVPESFKAPENNVFKKHFGEYQDDSRTQIIRVYADSNNLYEALVAAFHEAVDEIQKYEQLPSFGCKEHYD